MSRKDAIVMAVLCALVAIAATARLSGMTPVLFRPLPGNATGTRPTRRPHGPRERGEGLARLIWPPQRQRYLPHGTEASTLFEAGERIFVEGLYPAAAATYRRFIDRHPDQRACEVASFRIGQCLTLAASHAEAAAHYEKFLQTRPDSALRPMALLWSGVHHAHLGKRDVARARFQEILDRHPNTPFAEGARQRLAALDHKAPPTPQTSARPSAP